MAAKTPKEEAQYIADCISVSEMGNAPAPSGRGLVQGIGERGMWRPAYTFRPVTVVAFINSRTWRVRTEDGQDHEARITDVYSEWMAREIIARERRMAGLPEAETGDAA